MSREYWANLILCVFLAILAIFAVSRIGTVLTPRGLLMSDPEPSKEARPLLHDVRLLQYGLVQGENHQVSADFYIQNNSDQDVKNVDILCDFYDVDGSYLDREKWILYHTFPTGTEEKYTSVSTRFVNVKGPVDCVVTDLQPVKEPFFKLHRSGGEHSETQEEAHGPAESPGSH